VLLIATPIRRQIQSAGPWLADRPGLVFMKKFVNHLKAGFKIFANRRALSGFLGGFLSILDTFLDTSFGPILNKFFRFLTLF
jgi:hypothetical protein